MTMTILGDKKQINPKKSCLKSHYKALNSGTEDKFEAWLMTIEDRWTDEILDCLKGNFPDWRGQ
ncbi:hypothetical protein [Allocoleopsis franciscana]|uniref:Uncharacterized protein n=1 Tax=Allocoleopsis franciscana PCC 7113 TaxID=1173027 RepID=K9WCC7_9CYAN|nr:hypothetical protein [Allocoleopsis franciscana]AFZ17152.1 hypothetical protein Mic7113_1264 [Allocoleopsis franciscana PCC 7113]